MNPFKLGLDFLRAGFMRPIYSLAVLEAAIQGSKLRPIRAASGRLAHARPSSGASGWILATAGIALMPLAAKAAEPVNDFPTVARADYVFACMQVNGQSRESLDKCSCSVDVIASLIPFEEYEAVETILMIYKRGGKAQQEMSNGDLQRRVKDMRRAQVEGELRCF